MVAFFPDTSDVFYKYDEHLEADFVMQCWSTLNEFVCPETGFVLQNSQKHLVQGIKRLWTVAINMKRQQVAIHSRLCVLPLTFMMVLLRNLESEYLKDETGKMEADGGVAEALLQLFFDVHDKLPLFQKRSDTRISSRSVVLYLKHLIKEVGAGENIKALSHPPVIINNGRLKCPFRSSDVKLVLDAFRHFRDNILVKYTRGPVKFTFTVAREVLDIMEPTRESQLETAELLNGLSLILFVLSLVLLSFVLLIRMMSSIADPEAVPVPVPQMQDKNVIPDPVSSSSTVTSSSSGRSYVDAGTQYSESDFESSQAKSEPKGKKTMKRKSKRKTF